MSDQPKQTWDEMKKLYPNQWLMVVEFQTNKFGDITSGVVVGHGTGKTKLPAPPANRGIIALEYTGESTFPGGLRRFEYHHAL